MDSLDLPASLLQPAEESGEETSEKAPDDGDPGEPRLVPKEPTDAPDRGSPRRSAFELTMIVEPVEDQKTRRGYVLVVFNENSLSNVGWHVSTSSLEEKEMRASMEDELRETQHRMRTLVEEYDTSTEELQTSNEELRSANEELQIRKEELQSVNEELKTKVEEVNQANADLENLLSATDIGTVYLSAP